LGRRGSATRAREGQRVRLNHRRFEEHRSLAPRFPSFPRSRGPDRSRVRSLAPAPSQSFPSPPVVRPAPLERGSGFAFGVRPFAPSAVPLPLEVDPQRSRGPPRAESRAHLHALDVDHLPLDHLQDRRDAILGAPAVRPRTRDQRGDADASAGGDVPGVPLTPRGDDADERGGIGEGGDVEDDLEKERGGGAVARVERGEVGVEPFAAGARRVEVLTRLRSRGEVFFLVAGQCFFVRNARFWRGGGARRRRRARRTFILTRHREMSSSVASSRSCTPEVPARICSRRVANSSRTRFAPRPPPVGISRGEGGRRRGDERMPRMWGEGEREERTR